MRCFQPVHFYVISKNYSALEWRRFLPGVLSVAFAGLLMLVQLGLLLGMFGTVTVLVDRSKANLWVTSPETQSMDQAKDIPSNLAALLRLNSAVRRSETLLINSAVWQSGSMRVPVELVGLHPMRMHWLAQHPCGLCCARLQEPNSVVIDQAEAAKLAT